jgi:hypothetical protein
MRHREKLLIQRTVEKRSTEVWQAKKRNEAGVIEFHPLKVCHTQCH